MSPPADQKLTACSTDLKTLYTLGPAFLTNANIRAVSEGQSVQGAPSPGQVNLSFDGAGKAALATTSTALFQEPSPQNQFAIVINGTVQASPYFQTPILGGEAQISTDTLAEAEQLSASLQP